VQKDTLHLRFEKDALGRVIGELHVEDVRSQKSYCNGARYPTVQRPFVSKKMVLTLMRQMFRFAQDRTLLDNDPTSSIRVQIAVKML
jgi:hypothetical protein